jgi:NADPH2:quinone reductase
MKAVLMSAPGGPEVLQPAEIPTPKAGPNELLVRLRAAGINPLDTKVRKLHMYYPTNLPAVLGCDGAGTVEAGGTGVSRFKPGDDVYFFNNGLGSAPGTYAQYALIREDYAARKPATLSMAEAAAAPLVLITAWEALVDVEDGHTIGKVVLQID